MKYSYLLLFLTALWGGYDYLSSESLVNERPMRPTSHNNTRQHPASNISEFTKISLKTLFLKQPKKNREEIHINSEQYISSVKDSYFKNEISAPPREHQPLLDPYETKANKLPTPIVGYDNDYGEGVAIAPEVDTEHVGSENNFGEGVAINVSPFNQEVGYDNEYGEGVAANIDPILEELIANTPRSEH